MVVKVAVSTPVAQLIAQHAIELPGAQIVVYDEDESVPLPADANEVEGIVRWWNGKRFDAVLELAKGNRWIHTASSGLDYLLTPLVKQRGQEGMVITNSSSAFQGTMAEFVMGWILMVARRLPDLIQQQRELKWANVVQREVAGQTIGIIGAGTLAQTLCKRAKAFEMRTLCLRRTRESLPDFDETLYGADGLTRLLQESDYVVVAAALVEETRNMIGAAQLKQMKKTAWLINVARGGLVDEPALIEALQQQTIEGACLDVFQVEPLPTSSPLWTMKNVFIAPHNSTGMTDQMKHRQFMLVVDNIRLFAANKPLISVVDFRRGY